MITSSRNPKIVRTRKLMQRKHRQRERLFRVEGLQALHMALEGRYEPRELLYCEELFAGEGAPSLLERCRRTGAELVSVERSVMEGLSGRETPQGLVGVFPFIDVELGQSDLEGNELVVVLDRLQNAGNLATLLRTADAVGAGAVIMLEPCVDLYDPGAVRGSMGSIFNLPMVRTGDPEESFVWLKEKGFRAAGADPYEGDLWHRENWQGGTALVLGNEARGLSEDVRSFIDNWVRLPMVGKAESLNVSVVGGVLMYAWRMGNPVLQERA